MTTPDDVEPADQTLEPSRRVFVQRLAFLGGGSVVFANCTPKSSADAGQPPKKDALVSSHRTFTNAEWPILVAVVDRMLPKDQDAGGVEAGVPEYIDRMLATEAMQNMKASFVPGLLALDRRAKRVFGKSLTELSAEQRDEVITAFKNSNEKSGEARWYEMLVVLCLEGFLGDPSYGGNQGEVGWKLVGFELVGRNVQGDPRAPYDGSQTLHRLTCGGGKGC